MERYVGDVTNLLRLTAIFLSRIRSCLGVRIPPLLLGFPIEIWMGHIGPGIQYLYRILKKIRK